ncbi:hypothetical protein RND81_06G075000 [Saponaria officinalis]|uniref:Uncharacterized protein n=1 Tax=Saponaria officinalis TaxID=3572 RepID=A0AAW1KAZ3_SAPOF
MYGIKEEQKRAFSQFGVNHNAGAKSAFSKHYDGNCSTNNTVVLMPLFYYTPNVVLGTIISTVCHWIISRLPSSIQIMKSRQARFHCWPLPAIVIVIYYILYKYILRINKFCKFCKIQFVKCVD